MQLSSQARKAVAAGLAASTLLWSAALVAPQFASAAVHSDGCVVLSGGVVWLITGGTRRGFTSAEVFASSGYNFSQVVTATAEDVALPVGPIMTYADGTLVKGPNDPLVYLVAGGQKRPFTSGAVFTGLGYSFANIQQAPVNTFQDLPTGTNLDSTTVAHPAGTVVISNGALWWMTATGRMGFPTMAVFQSYGLMLTHVVAANSYDLAMPDQGAVVARAACTGGNPSPTPTPAGSVSVSLASDTPASNSVVLGQSTADLAHFTFTGSGAVTQLTFTRTGVSNNSLLSNVYLYNGNQRITDGSAVSTTGQITFANSAGLFNAPASISVRADISSSGTAGQTVGVAFASGMSGSNSISGSGNGNLMTSASATLAGANFTNSITPSTGNVNAGSMNYTVWMAPLAITTNSVWLKTAMFKEIGSANTDALTNYVLYVDGNQVATTSGLQSVNGSNYAVFNVTTPYSMQTGSHQLEVRADIVKGSGRTVQFILQNAADIMLTDSQFNLNTTPTLASSTFSSMSAGVLTISNGYVSIQADPAFSAVSTVTGGGTNVTLAKFKATGYGEDTQINTLTVNFTGTSGLTTGINNVTLMLNGAQVGSAQQISGTVSSQTAVFNLGSSLIIPAGQTVNLSVNADMIDHSNNTITTGTIEANLSAGSSNAQGRQSQNLVSTPAASGPALTVGAGGLTVSANAAYTNQTLSPNSTAQKLGSFVLQAGSSEGIRVSNLSVGLTDGSNTTLTNSTTPTLSNISNLRVAVNGGTPSSPIAPQGSNNNFSQNLTIPVNSTATVDVWGDLGSTGSGAQIKTTLTVTATGASSNTSASSSSVIGQTITLNSGTLSTPTFTTASSSPSSYIATAGSGATDGSLNSFNLAATSGAVTVTELKFVVNDASAGTVPTSGIISSIKVGSVSAPVITPAATAVASTGSTLNNTTDPVTFNVVTSANMSAGTVLTIGTEDLLVTAVPSSTSVTVRRGVDGTSAATHADSSTVNIHGTAYLTGLSLAVPNGQGGIYINATPTYSVVGTNGITASDTTSKIALSYTKYTSGTSTTAAAVTPVQANAMLSTGSVPSLTVTSTSNAGLFVGENRLFDVTVTPSSKGNIQLNTIVFTVTASGGATISSLSPRLAVGSTTITGSSCSGTTTVTCSFPTGYVLTAGTPQTLTLYGAVGGTLGSAGSSSVTTVLAASSNFFWTDTAGNGTVQGSNNSTYFVNYPTQTWSIHN